MSISGTCETPFSFCKPVQSQKVFKEVEGQAATEFAKLFAEIRTREGSLVCPTDFNASPALLD